MLFATLVHLLAAQDATEAIEQTRIRIHSLLPSNNIPGRDLQGELQQALLFAEKDHLTATGITVVFGDEHGFSGNKPKTFEEITRELTCKSDLIVIARPRTQTAHLSASMTSIYSDYTAEIQTVLRDNQLSPISPEQYIVITRPGGSATFPNGTVNYEYGVRPILQLGSPYLLFLHYIEAAHSYEAVDDLSSFRLSSFGEGENAWHLMRKSYSFNDLLQYQKAGFELLIRSFTGSCS